jgi:3-deoxy-manno-octulosonate cytidylyltransferase (CMP-KDO synthetase)
VTAVVIIPARLGSGRLPGKALKPVGGIPLVQRVWERACQAAQVNAVYIATDSEKIADVATAFGASVLRTGTCSNGTERVAQAAEMLPDADVVINVQVDTAELKPIWLDQLIKQVLSHGAIATLATPIVDRTEVDDPNIVKVVVSQSGASLYFSRCPIPQKGPWLRHVGVYAFPSIVLRSVATLPRDPLESSEDLEQLRWLAAGYAVNVVKLKSAGHSIDTQEQLDGLNNRLIRAST